MRNRRRLGQAGGHPPAFDHEQYRRRNTIERCIGKLKQHRAVATRYDKRDYIFNDLLATAAIVIWLRDLIKEPSDTALPGHWPEVQPVDTSLTWQSLLTWSDFVSPAELFSRRVEPRRSRSGPASRSADPAAVYASRVRQTVLVVGGGRGMATHAVVDGFPRIRAVGQRPGRHAVTGEPLRCRPGW